MSGARTVLPSGYTCAHVAAIVGMSEPQVRGYVRAEVLDPRRGPGGRLVFSFQDVVVLRSAKALAAHLPTQRVLCALRSLKARLPAGRPLAGLKLALHGNDVVARDAGTVWSASTGQLLLDFDVRDLAAMVAPLAAERWREVRGPHGTAGQWYALAVELEASGSPGVRDAYERALSLDPAHADACINLGKIHHAQGRTAFAAELFGRALVRRPDDRVAWFNLAVSLENLDRVEQARRAYERTLAVDPACADAYYRLSRLCEAVGDGVAARRHLRRYQELLPNR